MKHRTSDREARDLAAESAPATSGETHPPAVTDALLVCVDMQPVFVRAIVDGARVQRRCEFVVAVAHQLGLRMLFTEQVPAKLGHTAPELTALAPAAKIFGKNTFSALADLAIRDATRQSEAGHLLLCGIETPVCIYQTAIAALADGLEVTILSDAVGARRTDDARVCLEALARSGAHVLPAETIFYALLREVHHPFFKAYTQLVKSYG